MSDESDDVLAIAVLPVKSKAAQLLELLPAIESALRAGHSHVSIHEHLVKTKGLNLTFRYYELTLSRLRKRVKPVASQSKPTTGYSKQNHHDPRKPVSVDAVPVLKVATSKIQDILFGSASDFFS